MPQTRHDATSHSTSTTTTTSVPRLPASLRLRLHYFPLVAGTVWFATLTTLLLRWVFLGRPRYPEQANPDVPFISDIAAQTLKPVFIVGCAVTGVFFFGTVFGVSHVRCSPDLYRVEGGSLTHYRDDATDEENPQDRGALVTTKPASPGERKKKETSVATTTIVSFFAQLTGFTAALSLCLLSVFDTVDYSVQHHYLLMVTFAGLWLSAALTTALWRDQLWFTGPPGLAGLRKWVTINAILVVVQLVVGVLFVALMYAQEHRWAGYCEWTLTYLGAFWLLSFVGFVRVREDEKNEAVESVEAERQPLLGA
ncbi:Frag1/DRAM/Sfk1 [Microdochium trichocladiopsis]|uniref:Frag1/DRAM/Sfk1 n=1 Tax=Microdochium trichocladiopsis TaxID=1682393 RepID=A0A9P8YJY7_9PEZI|nr:Frag1/DRAM/Sfk1 [Microdochium trichocladiopsis]KAH7040816.1 Frag1/DRAM/Sfk1 [Microdochium trichocladiopsis]